jgi:hypothetical protein
VILGHLRRIQKLSPRGMEFQEDSSGALGEPFIEAKTVLEAKGQNKMGCSW